MERYIYGLENSLFQKQKFSLKFNVIPTQNPIEFFMKPEQLLIKYVWKNGSLKIPRQLSKERIARRHGWGRK